MPGPGGTGAVFAAPGDAGGMPGAGGVLGAAGFAMPGAGGMPDAAGFAMPGADGVPGAAMFAAPGVGGVPGAGAAPETDGTGVVPAVPGTFAAPEAGGVPGIAVFAVSEAAELDLPGTDAITGRGATFAPDAAASLTGGVRTALCRASADCRGAR